MPRICRRSRVFRLLATLGLVLGCGDSANQTLDTKTEPADKSEVKTHAEALAKSPDTPVFPPKNVEPKAPDTPKPPASLAEKIDAALLSAARLLAARQSADGAWRSWTLGAHKDGPSLTPLVAEALCFVADDVAAAARGKAADYLAAMVQSNGEIKPGPAGWTHPVYTASLAVVLLSRPEHARHVKAREAWLKMLRGHQLTEALGWKPDDAVYGGWGYGGEPPRKPPAGAFEDRLAESNLSATAFALSGLRAGGVDAKDPAIQKAVRFVERCQNFREPAARDPKLDDGGFFFILEDFGRNKAGPALPPVKNASDPSAQPPQRFRSYGSTTADGLRCLMAGGLPDDHPRVAAARDWLRVQFSAEQSPGAFDESQEHLRKALYFYYCNSAARALTACHVREVGPESGRVRWAVALAEQLLKLQQPDGSWESDSADMKENDPLIATAMAIGALVHCRAALSPSGQRGVSAP